MGASKLKFLLWDVDGVLVDTEELKYQPWRLLAERFGKALTLEEYLPFIGQGSRENMEAICALKGIPGSYEELNPIRRRYYETLRAKGFRVFEDNVRLVRRFKEKFSELVHAVVSSAPRTEILDSLQKCGFPEDFFAAVISYEDKPGMKRKPAPDMYLYAMEKLNAKAAECIAFEDSFAGVCAAQAAGMFCVALPNALTEKQDLSAANLSIGRQETRGPSEIVQAFGRW